MEYAHGGKKPLAQLTVDGAEDCAIDPTTGNLAVTGVEGGVYVFKRARGTPTTYTDPVFWRYYYCGYDDKGNLFIDGGDYGSQSFEFAELPKGGSALSNITLSQYIGEPGGVQWDGRYITVGNANGHNVYQFTISGSQGTKVGTTSLGSGLSSVGQYLVQGKTLVAPNYYFTKSRFVSNVLFYKYPAGGNAVKSTSKGMRAPDGVAVSLAPH